MLRCLNAVALVVIVTALLLFSHDMCLCAHAHDFEYHLNCKVYPAMCRHWEDAMDEHPDVLTVHKDPAQAHGRRLVATRVLPTKPNYQRDEYPPAMFREGGHGSSVRHIPSWENSSEGGSRRHRFQGIPDGTRVKFVPSYNLDASTHKTCWCRAHHCRDECEL